MQTRERNYVGYGGNPPHPHWPNQARIAINFVLNYEEGAEANIMDGDSHAENFLAEIANLTPKQNARNLFTESIFEYGSRAGIWRLLNLFKEHNIPISLFVTGLALERNPKFAKKIAESDHEIVGHGFRWINYADINIDEEREHINKTLSLIKSLTGKEVMGWYTGRHSENTHLLVAEAGLIYSSDNYSDDLPFWITINDKPLLIIPYTFDKNDAKYAMSPGWMSGKDFYKYLCASFDCLYREGATSPKMMTIALHGRLSGQPGRAEAIRNFILYAKQHVHVWFCTREKIAMHWQQHFLYAQENSHQCCVGKLKLSRM